jgi:hypothetical protein
LNDRNSPTSEDEVEGVAAEVAEKEDAEGSKSRSLRSDSVVYGREKRATRKLCRSCTR